MSAEQATQCWSPRPTVKRVSGGASRTRYEARCKCGWTFEAVSNDPSGRAARVTAAAEAEAHYRPQVTPEWLATFRALLPACFSPGQVELLTDLLNGQAIQSTAYGLRGRAARHRYEYAATFSAFLSRLRDRGAVIVDKPGPRGGVGSATYRLVGSQL